MRRFLWSLLFAVLALPVLPMTEAVSLTPESPAVPPPLVELSAMRTRDAAHFQKADGSYRAEFRRGINYLHDGRWDPTDLRWTKGLTGASVTASAVQLRAVGPTLAVSELTSGAGIRWTFDSSLVASDDEATVVHDGITWMYANLVDGVKATAKVASPRGATTYSFRYDLLGGADLGIDTAGNLVSERFQVPRAFVRTADGNVQYASPWRLDGAVASFTLDDGDLSASAFPYVIDPTVSFASSWDTDSAHVDVYSWDPTPTPVEQAQSTYIPGVLAPEYNIFANKEQCCWNDPGSDWGRHFVVDNIVYKPQYRFEYLDAFTRWDTSSLPDLVHIDRAEVHAQVVQSLNPAGARVYGEYYDFGPTRDQADWVQTANPDAADLPMPPVGAASLPLRGLEKISTVGKTGVRWTLSDIVPAPDTVNSFVMQGSTTLVVDYSCVNCIPLTGTALAFTSPVTQGPVGSTAYTSFTATNATGTPFVGTVRYGVGDATGGVPAATRTLQLTAADGGQGQIPVPLASAAQVIVAYADSSTSGIPGTRDTSEVQGSAIAVGASIGVAPVSPTLLEPTQDAQLTASVAPTFRVVATDPDADAVADHDDYRAIIRITGLGSAYNSAFMTSSGDSGEAVSGSPYAPLGAGTYTWTAQAVDEKGSLGVESAAQRFTVLSSVAGRPSASCDDGTHVFDGNVEVGYLKLMAKQVDGGLWLCVRIEAGDVRQGGRVRFGTATGAAPTIDTSDTFCATQPGGVTHLDTQVGPLGTPITVTRYDNADGAGICVRFGETRLRISAARTADAPAVFDQDAVA